MTDLNSIQNLRVWQKAHELTLMVYKTTMDFPKNEQFGLISQMRRSAVSVPSNISEGFRRRGKDKFVFYSYSMGSLEELKYQLLLSFDLNYLQKEDYDKTIELANETGKMLNAWINSVK
ncbi:MAG: four helix bundle protein [Candidatus Parcubacteria bacterium]|nr:four helix bundle protein [Candidatus Parcubacteria bacterium]